MQFQVPQFIEIEDKIFGPLTFKQFVYLTGGAGLAYIEWAYIPIKMIAILFIIPTIALAVALAFYKVNNRPFILSLEAAFRYALAQKLYIWKHQTANKSVTKPSSEAKGYMDPSQTRGLKVPKLSESKLKDLSWSLDVKETVK